MKYLIFLFFFLISCKGKSQESISVATISSEKTSKIPVQKITEIKNFIKGKKYNQDLAIFINFKIPSSKFRFFIYDLKNNKILEKAIVSHGSGSVVPNSETLKFSNIEDSYQSSLGKYEIQSKYEGKFGTAYRLKGLDKSNSNALSRAIVLHSYDCISDEESEELACLSLGCPMLSKKFFKTAEKYINSSKKPVLIYAFY